MEKLEVMSTSRASAVCSDIVVRDLETVRLVFRPEIVDNPHNPAACIRGTFIYQRKSKNEAWVDSPSVSLSSLKKGEGYQVEVKSGELLPLLLQLGSLYRIHRKHGVPQGRQQYVRMQEHLAQLLQLSEPELHEFLSAHPADAVLTLRKVLRWLSNSTALADFIVQDTDQIVVLNAVLGVALFRAVLGIWAAQADNAAEEFWQRTLGDHAFVLSQLYAYPIVVIGEKAYLGGKRLDNRHGNLADFLATASISGSPLIIEIKTPKSPLLGTMYRDDAYPLSVELSGAIAQVLKYRDSLAESARNLTSREEQAILTTEPRCMIIAGNSTELDTTAKRQSFERFRERLAGVTIVTFDELFERVRQLESLMAPPATH